MKFIVDEQVFKKLEDVCFGIVIARGINNKEENNNIMESLRRSITETEEQLQGEKVKEVKSILCYREAFEKLGINPNKYMSSIEAMITRVGKKKGLPNINPVVDLGNAVSLKYLVPLGAHDIEKADADINLRFSIKGDKFIPFGESEPEYLEDGELIYSAGDRVKTRRWIWRQSEEGKITEDSKDIFFPIDGFMDKNYSSIISARDELALLLERNFKCDVVTGFVDKSNMEFTI